MQIGACENNKFGQFFAREIVLMAQYYIETYHLQLAFISFVLLGSQSSFPINLCFKRSFCTFLVNFSIDVHILWYLLTKFFFQNEFTFFFNFKGKISKSIWRNFFTFHTFTIKFLKGIQDKNSPPRLDNWENFKKYTQSPLIRLTAKCPALEVLKNSSNLEAHHFLILQAWALTVS